MTEAQIRSFIQNNFRRLTNHQLSEALCLKLSAIRHVCYELGLKRMTLEYFTVNQIAYLKRHYKTIGDCELAEIFQQKWPKQKGWTNKHIEKKRNYLKLHRTKDEIKKIKERNVKAGRFKICPVKAWNKRGRAIEGEIRYWTAYKTGKKYPVVKHNGKFVHWARWSWEQKYGKIQKGKNVVFKDSNPYNRIPENLVLMTNAELSRRNSQKSSQGLSDNYIAGILTYNDPNLRESIKQCPHLLEMKRKQLTLNRIIYEQRKAS